jgi:hypothetical protein
VAFAGVELAGRGDVPLPCRDVLVAVTARSNRSKSDQGPADWLPPAPDEAVRCQYASEWVGTKLRWGLATDGRELEALRDLARECPLESVTYEPAG